MLIDLIGIRTVGWMLFFTSSLARFNLRKCVIRGSRCGQSLAQGPCNSAAMITTEVVPSPTSVSFMPNGTNKTKVGNDMK